MDALGLSHVTSEASWKWVNAQSEEEKQWGSVCRLEAWDLWFPPLVHQLESRHMASLNCRKGCDCLELGGEQVEQVLDEQVEVSVPVNDECMEVRVDSCTHARVWV